MLDTPTRPLPKRVSTPSTDFDFLMGMWRCHHRYRIRCLGGFSQRPGGPFDVFYGDHALDGRAIRVRTIWSRVATEESRWEQAFSLDEGNAWEANWTIDFTRL